MGEKVLGGCTCGAVTYEVSADPLIMLNCHCRDCQRATGSGFAPVVVYPRNSVRINGDLRYYRQVGEDGKAVERGICPNCGNPIANKLERMPDVLGVIASSLADPSLHQPSIDMFTASAQTWDHLGPATQKFERGLPVNASST